MMKVAIGCGIAFLLMVLGCMGTCAYMAANAQSFVIWGLHQGAVAVVNSSQLPQAEKQGVVTQLDRIRDEYKAGNLSDEQMQTLFEDMMTGGLIQIGVMQHLENQIDSRLTDESEKAEAKRAIRRLAVGLKDGTSEQYKIEQIIDPMMVTDPNTGETKVDPNLSREQIMEAVANAHAAADEAGIDEDPEPVSISELLREKVDKALEAAPATPAP